MSWHIVRKDLAQLWILVLLTAITQFANAGLWIALAHFQEPPELVMIAKLFPIIAWISISILIISCIHQDTMPGVSQDWLVRPIRRLDLLMAKILFVLIFVNVPMLLSDFVHAMVGGFGIRRSLNTGMLHGLVALIVLELPIFALGTITTGATQVIGGMLGIWLFVLAGVLIGTAARGGTPPPFALTGMQWMTPAFWTLLAVCSASFIISLQYFRRSTSRSRRIVAIAAILAPLLSYAGWGRAFGFQEWLSPRPLQAADVAIMFDRNFSGAAHPPTTPFTNTVLLPVTVTGLPERSLLLSDRADIGLSSEAGKTLYTGRTANLGYHDDFVVNTATGGSVGILQQINLPPKIYAIVRSRAVNVQIDYSLTLFHWQTLDTIPAINGDKRMRVFGWCKTRVDDDGDEIQFGCLKPGAAPSCISLVLENPENGRHNPENLLCNPDYAPYEWYLYPDAVSQFGGGVRFGDPQGITRFPVDGAQLGNARVVAKSFIPIAHFTRHLIAQLRPDDWARPTKGKGSN
jgi:hypothetical protein